MTSPTTSLATELSPHLLYRVTNNQAHFATWRLNTGHESLALFTTAETAKKYQSELADSTAWQTLEPSRDKLLDILHACRATGILYAALDPAAGAAKTLFDIPKVLGAASQLTTDN
jgi:hypothetical protein